MPWIIGGAIVGAGLLGDAASAYGASSTNQTNEAISAQNNQFNAQQAQLNRNFQVQSQAQAENYDTTMSNTAERRRVADLQAAGLNPMLAAGNPASAPQLSGQSGATASSAGLPRVDNPLASFSNAGQIAAQAAQASTVASQIDANTAQAGKARADANKANADAGYTQGALTAATQQNVSESKTRQELMLAQGDAARAQASLSRGQTDVAYAQIPKIQADMRNLASSTNLNDATAALRGLEFDMKDLEINQFAAISPEIVKSAIANANIGQMNAGMLSKAFQTYQGAQGNVGAYLDRIANWFHIGVNLSQYSGTTQVTK